MPGFVLSVLLRLFDTPVGMRLRIENLQTYLSVQASSLVFVICQQSFFGQEAPEKFEQMTNNFEEET